MDYTKKIFWGDNSRLSDFHKSKFEEFMSKGQEHFEQSCRDEDGRLQHIVSAEHFDLSFLKTIRDTANSARRISKIEPNYLKGLLRHVSILNYFQQPSTRTFLSFSRAQSKLGIQREEVRDISTSSSEKGESDLDALRTQSSFYEGMTIRHKADYFSHFAVWSMLNSQRPLHIFNAGSGVKEHPTQAILDHYTKEESLGSLEGITVAYYGDCKRGRTVHSGSRLLALHKDITIMYVAPERLQIDAETEQYLERRRVKVIKKTDGIGETHKIADVNYVTRLQDEYGSGKEKYPANFIFTEKHLDSMPDHAILMHPMPKREEIEPQMDYIDNPKIMWWRQQRNGMWTRLATIAYVYGVDEEIRNKYQSIETKMKKIIKSSK